MGTQRDTAPSDAIGSAPGPSAWCRGTWVVDLDGVVWLSGQPLPGVGEAIGRLRAAGIRVLFVTNNAEPTEAVLRARLARAGIEAGAGELITSAHAAASLVPAGGRALAVGGEGVEEALAARGVVVTSADDRGDGAGPSPATTYDAVVVGLTKRFDYSLLAQAATAVRRGARLIGTNDDPTHPTPEGLLPGSGALVAAVATAAQATPVVAGKPHAPMVELIRARADDVVLVVGDRPSTDGRLAQRLGVSFALVRSDVLGDGPVDPPPDIEADGLRELVETVLAG